MAEPTGVEAPVEDAGAVSVDPGEIEGENVPSEYTSETPAEAGQAPRRTITTGQAAATGRRIVFFCAFGERSAMAVTAARDAGLANTAHIAGGIDAWKKAGGPILTG